MLTIGGLTKLQGQILVPKVDECIDAISGSKLFSTVDLTCGYLQVPVREQDVSKTAFVSRHGLYEFTSTPFGMINSGATFQRVMELAMKGLKWQICFIYIDDCIIFSSTFDEHIERLRLVFPYGFAEIEAEKM